MWFQWGRCCAVWSSLEHHHVLQRCDIPDVRHLTDQGVSGFFHAPSPKSVERRPSGPTYASNDSLGGWGDDMARWAVGGTFTLALAPSPSQVLLSRTRLGS